MHTLQEGLFLGGGSGKNAMAFLNYNLPKRKAFHFSQTPLFSTTISRGQQILWHFDLFPQMIAPLFMVSDINKQQKRGNLREPLLWMARKLNVEGSWDVIGVVFVRLLLFHSCFFFFAGEAAPDFPSCWLRLSVVPTIFGDSSGFQRDLSRPWRWDGKFRDPLRTRVERKEDPTTCVFPKIGVSQNGWFII